MLEYSLIHFSRQTEQQKSRTREKANPFCGVVEQTNYPISIRKPSKFFFRLSGYAYKKLVEPVASNWKPLFFSPSSIERIIHDLFVKRVSDGTTLFAAIVVHEKTPIGENQQKLITVFSQTHLSPSSSTNQAILFPNPPIKSQYLPGIRRGF